MAKRKLGRGLDALIGATPDVSEEPEAGSAPTSPDPVSVDPAEDERDGEPAATAVAKSAPRGRGASVEGEARSEALTTAGETVPQPGRKDKPAGKGKKASTPAARSPREKEVETIGAPAPVESGVPVREDLRLIELDPARIAINPDQPRREFSREELEALRTSVGRDGVLQPIVVRRTESGAFQLVAGERRLRVAKDLGLSALPARVLEVEEDRLLEFALVENLHRADLNPIELAEAYELLLERNGWTQDQLAEHLGMRRPSISNTIRLLDLPDVMRRALIRGQIKAGHAKVLLSVADAEARQKLFDRIAEENLSVRELEDERDDPAEPDAPVPPPAPDAGRPASRPDAPRKPHLEALEAELSEHLGVKVRIREKAKGRGRVQIDFYSESDFDRLRNLLLG